LAPLSDAAPAEGDSGAWDLLDADGGEPAPFELSEEGPAEFAKLVGAFVGAGPKPRALTLTWARRGLLTALDQDGWTLLRFGDHGAEAARFDLFLSAGSALSCFDESGIERIVAAAAEHLPPGGRFVLEAPNFCQACKPVRSWSLEPRGMHLQEAALEADTCELCRRHVLVTPDLMVETAARLRALTCPEWLGLLDAHGLTPADLRGHWDGSPYADASPRLIILARKR